MRCRPWLLLALIGLLVLSPPAEAAEPTSEATVYAVATDDGSAYTVFQRITPPSGTIGVPPVFETLVVTDENGAALAWAEARSGIIEVSDSEADAVLVTARGVPGPAETQSVGIGLASGVRITAFVVALPDDYTIGGLDEVSRQDLVDREGLSSWPLPQDHTYWASFDPEGAPHEVRVAASSQSAGAAPYALLAVLLVLLGITTVWLMRRVHRGVDARTRPSQMPILSHLEELRARVLWIFGTLVVAASFFFTFGLRWTTLLGYRLPIPYPSIYNNAAAQVFAWLSRHVVPPEVQVIVVSPWDAVGTQITIAFALAVAVTFPVLFYHVYAFLAPALYPRERRAVFLTVPVVVILFVLGAGFGLGLMLPFTITVLYGFAGTLGATAFLNVPELVSLGTLMGLVFGLAFELPVVMALLSAIGLIPAATWRHYWRHAVVIIALVAAIITDPTILTQLIVGSVLLLLYGIGIVLAMAFEKKVQAAGEDGPLGDRVRG